MFMHISRKSHLVCLPFGPRLLLIGPELRRQLLQICGPSSESFIKKFDFDTSKDNLGTSLYQLISKFH